MLNFDASPEAPLYMNSGMSFLFSGDDEGNFSALPADPATWRRMHPDEE